MEDDYIVYKVGKKYSKNQDQLVLSKSILEPLLNKALLQKEKLDYF